MSQVEMNTNPELPPIPNPETAIAIDLQAYFEALKATIPHFAEIEAVLGNCLLSTQLVTTNSLRIFAEGQTSEFVYGLRISVKGTNGKLTNQYYLFYRDNRVIVQSDLAVDSIIEKFETWPEGIQSVIDEVEQYLVTIRKMISTCIDHFDEVPIINRAFRDSERPTISESLHPKTHPPA